MKKDKRVVFQIGLREWYKIVYKSFDTFDTFDSISKEMVVDIRKKLNENNRSK